MRILFGYQWFLLLVLLATCFLLTNGRGRGGGGRGGGGRGGGSRGGSSRGRPSTPSRNPYRERPSESRSPSNPAPAPAPLPKPAEAPKPKPSAPELKPQEPNVVRQPAYNPNYRESSPNQGSSQNQPAQNPNYRGQNPPANQQPPPYAPRENPPPYSPAGQQPPHGQGVPPPAYNPNQPSAPLGPPPPYSAAGQPNYRQPYPQQPGMQPPPYPQQPGMRPAPYPQQPGMGSAPYPQQPGMRPAPYPQQPGMGSAPYPQQPGMRPAPYPQQPGMGSAPYPQQPGWNRMPYPQQPGAYRPPYPQQTLGSNMYHPKSGMPAPAYMNYGGLPTGTNMYAQPHKKKGFLGSLFSMGSGKSHKTPKYYGSQPSPYGMGAMGAAGMGGFMGKHGSKAAMYTILPYMAAKKSRGLFKPRFGSMPLFLPLFLPSLLFHHHHYGHGYSGYGQTYYNVYNTDYIGKCNKPLTPENAHIQCNSTNREVACNVQCEEGYRFPDNTTLKANRCWHVSGVWRPTKNFPACKAVCNETCQNGGQCLKPGACVCPAEYRGPHCEFHFLNCDIRKIAGDNKNKIRWVCTHTKNESVCRVKCRPPSEFITPSVEEYKCNPEGVWTPDSMPKCVIKSETEDENLQEKPEDTTP